MALSLKEFIRFKKFMMRTTTGSSDTEVLFAIRAANQVLDENGLTWDKVFERVVTIINEADGQTMAEHPPAGPAEDETDLLFETALDGVSGSFRDTLLSIQDQHERKGWLSARQWEVVHEAARRNRER